MSRRFALVGLSSITAFVALDLAQADSIFPSTSQGGTFTSCRFGADGPHCTHFEGYVVVRRHDAAAATKGDAKADAILSANRLYLPASDNKTP